jgi:cytochrome d ubiquinol oxidase subunit I
MELTSIAEVIFNPVAQAKFVHTVAAGYVTASMFVLGISSYYLLKGRDVAFALRSFAIAAAFGLASTLSVIVLGDESGYTTGEVQKVKLAAMEAEWETQPAPASFMVFGIPDEKEERSDFALHVPWMLGLIATRSTDKEVSGIRPLREEAELRIRSGQQAYAALQAMKRGDRSPGVVTAWDEHGKNLGYGLLLKRYTAAVVDATEAQIKQASHDTIPKVAPLFWAFRAMVGLGLWFLLVFGCAFYFLARRDVAPRRWLLRAALYSIPLPWIAAELGWFVAEYGRQPWTISGVLPTFLSASSLKPADLYLSLAGLVGFYSLLLVVELYLMFKYARLGPSSLGQGRYHFETQIALPAGASHA